MDAVCEVCGAIGYEYLLLCCSDCKGGHTHQYCLAKVLFDSTLEDWFCDECNQRHNEGSHSRSLEKVSSERPSNHAPAPFQSPSTRITQNKASHTLSITNSAAGRNEALAVCLPSHVQSKVITHNQTAPEHDPPTGSDGGRRASQEQGKQLREGHDGVWQRADGQRDTRTPVGLSETNKELTFEQVSRHFSMPIQQAARQMNVGITALKKQCRKLGIRRWPHRKVKSLQKLIDNVQGLGRENAQANRRLSKGLVGLMQQTTKLFGERPTEELRQVCFNESNAQEDGHLTRSVVEFLQLTKKKMVEERPDMVLDQRTKHLRQMCFKESYNKRKRS